MRLSRRLGVEGQKSAYSTGNNEQEGNVLPGNQFLVCKIGFYVLRYTYEGNFKLAWFENRLFCTPWVCKPAARRRNCRRRDSVRDRAHQAAGYRASDLVHWPIATDDALTANRRFRGIADMADPPTCPAQEALLQPRSFGQIETEPRSLTLIAPRHLHGGMAELLLDLVLIGIGGCGEAGAHGVPP